MNGVKFVFRREPATVAWPCRIPVPKDGGAIEPQLVVVRFRVLNSARLKELAESGFVAVLEEAIIGFDDLRDESGAAVGDDEAKRALLALPYAVTGLADGYLKMLGARLEKN